jgi:hypothetical protein
MERETRPEVKNPGVFKKGHEKLGGRKVGTHNATTKLLKECILMAAELEGSDGNGKDELVGFLRRLANEDIRAFAMLLGRVLPLQQIESRDDMRVEVVYDTLDDVRAELAARGITIEAVKQLLYLAPEKVE